MSIPMQMASERFAAAAWFLTTSPMPIVQSGAPVEFLAKWYVSPSSVYQNCWHPLTCPVKISLPPTEHSLQYPDVAAKGSLEEKSVSLFFGSKRIPVQFWHLVLPMRVELVRGGELQRGTRRGPTSRVNISSVSPVAIRGWPRCKLK
jgi:hypothetical protein